MNLHKRISTASLPALLFGSALVSDVACSGDSTPDVGEVSEAVVKSYTDTFQEGLKGYSGTADAYLLQLNSSTNYGTASTLLTGGDMPSGTGKDVSIVLRWNVSSIPPDARVTSVTLRFLVTDPSPNAYPVYPLWRNWTELGVTWNNALPGTNWATAGAMRVGVDRGPNSIGTISVAPNGPISVTLNSAGIDTVQTWVSHPSSNFGIIIASPSNTDRLGIASSEYGAVLDRPKLTIDYTRNVNPGAGGAATGGAPTGGAPTAIGGAGPRGGWGAGGI